MSSRNLLKTFTKNRIAVIGVFLSLFMTAIAIFAPWISPYDPMVQNVQDYKLAPPQTKFIMGTDGYGRDIFSRVVWASRISLTVGVGSVLLALVAGCLLGMIAAYHGGYLDYLIMRSVDIMLSFPTLVLGIMISAILGSGVDKLILTIGFVMTPRFARMCYGPILSFKESDCIESARAIGARSVRILRKYIFPNIMGEIIVMATLWTGTAIVMEASLSFLGLGVSPPTPTWGNLCRAGMNHLEDAPWMFFFPGLAILIAVLGFNLIGDGLRDITDPKLYEK
ncbi:MAG: ABC transporter permease [Deltaproteobacteria bacterium]|nr:ABC transporter permease [Deltaproteobacteria bacterium]